MEYMYILTFYIINIASRVWCQCQLACRVATSEACSRIVQRRVQQVQSLRQILGVDLEGELRVLPKNERQELLITA